MILNFQPDYNNILNTVYKMKPKRIPLYEHIIDLSIMEKILGEDFSGLYNGDEKERRQYFNKYIQYKYHN